MDWWEEIDLGNGTRLTYLPTQHWSMRMNQGRNKSLWGTFHLGSEPAGFPGPDLTRYIQKQKLDPSWFKIMDIGEILDIQA